MERFARLPFATSSVLLLIATGLLWPLLLPVSPELPPALLRGLSIFLLFGACCARLSKLTGGLTLLVAGSAWTLACMADYQSSRLPETINLCHWHLTGTVTGLPETEPQRTRLDMIVQAAMRRQCPSPVESAWSPVGERVRLSLYHRSDQKAEYPQPDDRLTVLAWLRAPRGSVNPGGFDYEAYLARQNIVANGYISRLLASAPGVGLDSLRQRLGRWLAQLPGLQNSAQIRALLIADHRGLTSDNWQLLRDTGTVHLLVVSGLHISLIAGLGWLAGAGFAAVLGIRRYWLAALSACALALVYSLAAGFGISAQRALTMVVIFAGTSCLHRQIPLSHRYLYSLVAVLIMSPLAPLGAGFWLSFTAVFTLLLLVVFLHGRHQSWLSRLLLAQLALAMILLPVVAYWQAALAPATPLANSLAVPWLSFLVMPGLLLALPVDALVQALGMEVPLLLHIPDKLLAVLQSWLGWLAQSQPLVVQPSVLLLLAVLAALAVWLPLSRHARLTAGCLWAVILFAGKPATETSFRLLLLDVGQGFSAFVQSGRQAVVYDVGPRYGDGFDAGRDILVPALHHFGVRHVSHIVVSHSDLDHAGGFMAVHKTWPKAVVIAGQPEKLPVAAQPCHHQRWRLGESQLLSLRPVGQPTSDNDASCALIVRLNDLMIVLPGDLSAQGELALLSRLPPSERTVLFASHHGSGDASHPDFLRALQPEVVLYSAGWRNRHHHPSVAACRRARAVGARLFSTARQGAVEWVLRAGQLQMTKLFRCQKRWWRPRLPQDCHLPTGLSNCAE